MKPSEELNSHNRGNSRREFLQIALQAPALTILSSHPGYGRNPVWSEPAESEPWYRTAYRWGQTNINEKDPLRYDIGWWRQHWKRTRVQGIVVNAAGIVAYYPSRFPLQYRAKFLEGRDLFGELVEAAHSDGILVFARMDSNRAHEEFFQQHPDWFAIDANGEPYRAGDLYVSCISGPYYEEYLPEVLKEVISRYHPEGFTDNSWSGLDRNQICHCEYCQRRFRDFSGSKLPKKKDWKDPAYRKWIRWSYQRRIEIWDLNNRVTRSSGGRDCIWVGMVGGNIVSQGKRFRDLKSICERAEMIMFDDQGRTDRDGFQSNGEMGKRIHGLLGWNKLMPESMATYQRNPTFRKAAASEPEARMWMIEGIAGTIQPWWHHVGAYQEDRRQFRTAEPIYRWYEKNQDYLVKREPVATVGVVWSQDNTDFYGRDQAEEKVILPYRGINQALIRARIPYLPVHADHIERDSKGLSVLILPNLASMSETQIAAVEEFAGKGGNLLATGETGLYDEWGDLRNESPLLKQMGVSLTGKSSGPDSLSESQHSYFRLQPDVGTEVYGPRSGEEPAESKARHPVLEGFEDTNILPFGGLLLEAIPESDCVVPLTLIPDFPIYPPETSWMREPRTNIPGLILRQTNGKGRMAYLPADLDRRFALFNLPDHARLLANLVRWLANGQFPLQVSGTGLLDCHLYRQNERLILHLVNLTSAASWRPPIHELIPVGPFQVAVKLPTGWPRPKQANLLVSLKEKKVSAGGETCSFEVDSILDHEVIVLESGRS